MPKQFEYEEIQLTGRDAMPELKQKGKEGWELVATFIGSAGGGVGDAYGILKKEIEPSIEQKQTQSNDNKYSWER